MLGLGLTSVLHGEGKECFAAGGKGMVAPGIHSQGAHEIAPGFGGYGCVVNASYSLVGSEKALAQHQERSPPAQGDIAGSSADQSRAGSLVAICFRRVVASAAPQTASAPAPGLLGANGPFVSQSK